MKATIIKISFTLLLLSFMGAGCEKEDELFWEISPDSKTAVIQKEVNGIEFKFCLLNEQGEPATVFNEGENFTFQFLIKNNLDKTIYFDNGIFDAPGFCEIKSGIENFGSPFKAVMIDEIGKFVFSIHQGAGKIWEVPWVPENEEWINGHVHFKRNNTAYLSKGAYYTTFSHGFDFGEVKTDVLTFKINFEIK